jgi:hypothetical protein
VLHCDARPAPCASARGPLVASGGHLA